MSRTGAVRGFAASLLLGLLPLLLAPLQAAAADDFRRASFEREHVSREARYVADWVVHAGDNHAGENRAGENRAGENRAGENQAGAPRLLPFVVVDKKDAKVFVFDRDGRLQGAAPALLGEAIGDDAVPGIGDRELSSIRREEKTTPAGRFVSALGGNMRGEDVLWVDYKSATSMHRVLTTNPKERRLQRLASPTPLDNRISYGCINIPAKFYENVVRPAFSGTYGIVYVLPETRLAQDVFASYGVEEYERLNVASHAATAKVLQSN